MTCADIGCLKKPKEHLHEDQPMRECTAQRGQTGVEGTTDTQTGLSANMAMSDRDHHGAKEEDDMQIATEKNTTPHLATTAAAVHPTMAHLQIEVSYWKDYH